jgi:putative copper export protein
MLDDGGFGVSSPLYAALRWLEYACMLALVGAVVLVRVIAPRAAGQRAAFVQRVGRGAGRVLGVAAAALALATVLRLVAQVAALKGGDASVVIDVPALVMHTMWGWSWLLELAGVALAAAAVLPPPRAQRARWRVATIGVAALAVSFALGGHAVGVTRLRVLTVVCDALHVLGAGGWLGTLLVVAVVAIPAALAEAPNERGRAVADVVNAFSPVALFCAAVVLATGVVAAWMHLGALAALWQSDYGRTLLIKLALVATVAALGAINWRILRPALGTEQAAVRIQRSAAMELVVGAAVLVATAVLVAASPPMEMKSGMAGPHQAPAAFSVPDAASAVAGPPSHSVGMTMRVRVPRTDGT